MISILHVSDPHYQTETMARLSNLAVSHPNYDVVALTGDNRVLPTTWNDWPQPLKFSVPGNHDSPETFDHLKNWVHTTPWFRRYKQLVFLGIDTSDLINPYATFEDQIDPFWDEEIEGVIGFVLLTHQWPPERNLDRVGQLLAKFIVGRPLLILDGHNHPRGTSWETTNLGGTDCFRSTVISCNAPKGNAHLVTWDGDGFDCETVRGEDQRPKGAARLMARIKTGMQTLGGGRLAFGTVSVAPPRSPWVKCKSGMSEKRSARFCRYCGKSIRDY